MNDQFNSEVLCSTIVSKYHKMQYQEYSINHEMTIRLMDSTEIGIEVVFDVMECMNLKIRYDREQEQLESLYTHSITNQQD